MERFEEYDLTLITSNISSFPHGYIDLIYYPTILEKLYERFYNDEKLVSRLVISILYNLIIIADRKNQITRGLSD